MPPSSANQRELWALEHPNIAGVYFGLFFSLVVAVSVALTENIAFGGAIVPILGITTGMFFAKGMRGADQRRGRSGYQASPGFWSRFSDRFLFWMMFVPGVSLIASAIDFVAGTQNRWWAAGGACLSVAFAVGAGIERHRRRGGPRP